MLIAKTDITLSIIFIISLALSLADPDYAKYLAAYMVYFCFYIVWVTNKPLIAIYAIFISTYFIYMIPYFFFSISFASVKLYQDQTTSVLTLQMISYFVFIFLLLIRNKGSSHIGFLNRIHRVNNPPAYWLSILGLNVFSYLMVNPAGTILTSTYGELTEERFAFIGYSLVLVVLASITHKSRPKTILLVVSVVVYCLVCLLYGYRLRFLNIGLLFYLIFLEHKLPKKLVVIVALIGFLFMSFLSNFRSGIVSGNILTMLGQTSGGMVSNQGGVFLTSNIYAGAVIDNLITLDMRLGSALSHLLSSLIPVSLYPSEYNLKLFASSVLGVPGGGFITAYLFVFGGITAVAIFPFILVKAYRVLFSHQYIKGYIFSYLITVSATFLTWFAYTPASLFKMCVYSLVGYVLVVNYGFVDGGRLSFSRTRNRLQ